MKDIDKSLLPEVNLETDDIAMNIVVKKDYSHIEDLNEKKEEFIKDLFDFIKEFNETPESLEFMKCFDY